MKRFIHATGWVGFPALLMLFPCVAQAGDEQLEQVIRDWQARRRIATTAEYRAEGTRTDMPGIFDDWPKKKHVTPISFTWLFDFHRNRCRKEALQHFFFLPLSAYAPLYRVEAYDGRRMLIYEPREKNTNAVRTPSEAQPDLTEQTEDYLNLFFSYFEDPVFLAHGLVKTRQGRPLPKAFLSPLDAADFVLNGEGEIGGTRCLVLRTKPDPADRVQEYWVDPTRCSAVLRYSSYTAEVPLAQFDITYKATQWGWLPEGWTYTDYDYRPAKKGTVCILFAFTVKNIAINPAVSGEEFRIDRKPGMILLKNASNKSYRVRDDGSLEDFIETDGQPRRLYLGWSLGIMVVFVLGGLAALGIRRRRRRKVAS